MIAFPFGIVIAVIGFFSDSLEKRALARLGGAFTFRDSSFWESDQDLPPPGLTPLGVELPRRPVCRLTIPDPAQDLPSCH
jgi:hypothetical protein